LATLPAPNETKALQLMEADKMLTAPLKKRVRKKKKKKLFEVMTTLLPFTNQIFLELF